MGKKEHTSGNVWATLNGWLKGCVKRTSGCVVTAILWLHIGTLTCFGFSPEPVTSIDAGQNYSDKIYYKVLGSSKRYDIISEYDFLAKLSAGQCFLYRWYPPTTRIDMLKYNFAIDDEQLDTTEGGGGTTKIVDVIKAAGMPIFTSFIAVDESKILKLFPQSEIESGYVLGVVSKELTRAYDMTSRSAEYQNKGSYTAYDGKTYVTSIYQDEGELNASYIELNTRGKQALYNDLIAGRTYIAAKDQEEKETEQTLPDTDLPTATETEGFTNIVITTYYTNITVIVDPYFQNLNSVLKFKYPKYATEGDYIVYELTRSGVLVDPLTVHLVTNGHWCANVSWAAKEDGTKKVRVKLPISDEFNDNAPLEVVVKTLSRRVESEL